MANATPRRPSRLRRLFRWCRIVVWLLVLAALIAGIYLNTVGLPDFLKKPLLAKLRDAGVQVEFQRMRLRWYRGIVVDHATFTFVKHSLRPKFSADEAVLNPDLRSLRGSKLRLDSVAVKQGELLWPVSTNSPLALTVSNINTRIQFPQSDTIGVSEFDADFANTKISVSGVVSNATAMRAWKIFQRKPPREKKRGLEKFALALRDIHLEGSPELKLEITGDAALPETLRGQLSFVAPEANTPWGNGTNLQVSAEVRDFFQTASNNFVRVKADALATRWLSASNFSSSVRLALDEKKPNRFSANLRIYGENIRSERGGADSIQLAARTAFSLKNPVPTNATGKLVLRNPTSKWGDATKVELSFVANTNAAPKVATAAWAAWRFAEPFALKWNATVTGVKSPKLQIENLDLAGAWRAPELQITNLQAALYDGKARATAQLNVATRKVRAKAVSDFDVQKISPLLTPFGQRWIAKYTWDKPPLINGDLSVVLPAWTNHAPNWRGEVLPTLALNGHVDVGHGTYRGVSVMSAKTDFVFSNMVWTLPHLRANRPEGGADLNLVADNRAHSYHWKIHSEVDPKAIRHLLTEKQQRVLDDFHFTAPPIIRADLRGHWHELEEIAIDGHVLATKFSFRSNSIDKVSTSFQLTNKVLSFTEMRLDKGDKFITGNKITLDVPQRRIHFANVYGTVDPYLVTRLIGRKVAKHIAPYQFAESPAIRVNGSLSLTNVHDADLHFLVDGNHFHWNHFDADRVSGRLDWVNETLSLTNLHASAYRGGTVEGWAFFDFAPTNGTEFRFDLAAADLDLNSFISGLTEKTNRLEGMLHGQFTLESGSTRDLNTWRGYGRANLRDGLIWDVPIFGIFSPVLNAIMPGAGNSRAREGSATYVVRNGMVYSDDLEIRAAGLRLQYRGAVNFDKQVDARVEAELLRDTWVIGPIVSLALSPISKIFEYQVTGTLSEPKSEPVYIPNILMMTLRPFHSIKEALSPDKAPGKNETKTESPASRN